MTHLLEVNEISISFGGIKAVQNLSFYIDPGEILGMIGPNGSGKTTAINLISGAYPMDSGSLVFDGKNITNAMDPKDRARVGIGRTFQTPKPFGHLSVFDNVFAIALQRHDFRGARKRTDEILEMTKLDANRDMISSKLPIEKRKWLDFARVLSIDPKLIMMDESLSGLNVTEMKDSIQLVREINQTSGIAILFVEHVMKAVVDLCHRVIVLNEGRLLAEGTPSDVLAEPNVIAAYIGGE